MSPSGYTIEITNLSSDVTKKDIYDFFAFCGAIQHVEIHREGECECKAYVTFRNRHAVETAVILNGSTILDRPICIIECGYYEVSDDLQNPSPWKVEDDAYPWKSRAQNVVKTMASKGKDVLGKAKAFDESRQLSAKVAELSRGVGLTEKITAGVEAAKSVDQRYNISGTTKVAVSTTRSSAISAASTVVSSRYFSKGALWVSGALSRASQVAADLSSRGVSK